MSALRGLVEKIVALPAEARGQFDLEPHGRLAEALNMGKLGNCGGGNETGIETFSGYSRLHSDWVSKLR